MAIGDRDESKLLKAALKSGSFAPVYYFHGDDEYMKNEQLRRVIDEIGRASCRERV